jgi:hypothetical protein
MHDDVSLSPSSGEIHYLWWFIQGSIMNPGVRIRLRNAWGFCERHAWVAMLVEASLRHCFMMGPALLYEELLGFAANALKIKGLLKNWRSQKMLGEKGPCLMCDMGLGPYSPGFATQELIARGRDIKELCRFAEMTRLYWEKTICGLCLGNGSWLRCRPHLIEDVSHGFVSNLARHYEFINHIRVHMVRYYRSFRWECRGTATDKDRASLISAVGWCSGWRPFLSIAGMKK